MSDTSRWIRLILPAFLGSYALGQSPVSTDLSAVPISFELSQEKQHTGAATKSEPEQEELEDEMEDIQSFNTYISLEDGQPGQRGEFQVNIFNGWETSSGESVLLMMVAEFE